MPNQATNYLVGIDLGTTHTVVAYAKFDALQNDISIFPIEQLVTPGQVDSRSLLPSVRYHPADGEIAGSDAVFAEAGETAVIGEAARLLGAKSTGRLVTSAKSWLSHPSVDHGADILPWGSDESVRKISPIEASASYLAHVRMVWQHQFPGAPLEKQSIVITVPASFDEEARSLTLEAARMAGLEAVHLLEEPQAVFYDWLRRHGDTIHQHLDQVHLLLICDVGGGTTDLTLVKVEAGEPEPKLTRIGVGDHLMLGGDNIDLALAHLAEKRLAGQDQRLSAADLAQLLEQCRQAKETLLAEEAPEQVKVTLLGGGSRLIGQSRSATLSRDEVRAIALDGFFPLSALNELPDRKRSGVVEFGLPYAAEPAISKHIAAFLQLHKSAAQDALKGQGIVPDALLLNGGVFRSQPVKQRLVDLLAEWAKAETALNHAAKMPVLLDNQYPELAVAFGAVSYAMARRDRKLKIGGGSARSYFLVVATDAVENKNEAKQYGICVLPKGSEEGEEIVLSGRQFVLRLGVPVRFHLVSLSGDTDYKPGDIAEINDRFHSLPPLALAFDEADSLPAEAVVQLAVMQTEIGTLKIQCVWLEDSRQRWDVEFQIRKKASVAHSLDANLSARLDDAVQLIHNIFGVKSKQIDPKAVKNLRADLEKTLHCERSGWGTPLLRALFAALLEGAKFRRRSEHHERVWLSLAGFCCRPGFGYPLDDWRVEQLWKLYPQGIQFVTEAQNWTEWWTLWRRVAGGLGVQAQQQVFSDIAKYVNPATARQPNIAKQIKQRGYDDIVRLAAVLERLPVSSKIELGVWLLYRLQKTGESNQTWWALGRIGARVPVHGSSHNVIPAMTVSAWLMRMLAKDWKKMPQIGFAATLMARLSGDRARDLDEGVRRQIVENLKATKSPASWIDLLENVKELDEKEEKLIFGEALPPGLKLINSD